LSIGVNDEREPAGQCFKEADDGRQFRFHAPRLDANHVLRWHAHCPGHLVLGLARLVTHRAQELR
jgi:hypothetical protein